MKQERIESIKRQIKTIETALESSPYSSISVPGMAASVDRKHLEENLNRLYQLYDQLTGNARSAVRTIDLSRGK